jgi:hypothetical protein
MLGSDWTLIEFRPGRYAKVTPAGTFVGRATEAEIRAWFAAQEGEVEPDSGSRSRVLPEQADLLALEPESLLVVAQAPDPMPESESSLDQAELPAPEPEAEPPLHEVEMPASEPEPVLDQVEVADPEPELLLDLVEAPAPEPEPEPLLDQVEVPVPEPQPELVLDQGEKPPPELEPEPLLDQIEVPVPEPQPELLLDQAEMPAPELEPEPLLHQAELPPPESEPLSSPFDLEPDVDLHVEPEPTTLRTAPRPSAFVVEDQLEDRDDSEAGPAATPEPEPFAPEPPADAGNLDRWLWVDPRQESGYDPSTFDVEAFLGRAVALFQSKPWTGGRKPRRLMVHPGQLIDSLENVAEVLGLEVVSAPTVTPGTYRLGLARPEEDNGRR